MDNFSFAPTNEIISRIFNVPLSEANQYTADEANQRLLEFTEEEVIDLWKEIYNLNRYFTQSNFTKYYGINQGNFSRYLTRRKDRSPVSHKSMINYFQNSLGVPAITVPLSQPLQKAPKQPTRHLTIMEQKFQEWNNVTRTCRYYIKGDCPKGETCPLVHDTENVREEELYYDLRDEIIRSIESLNIEILILADMDNNTPSIDNLAHELPNNLRSQVHVLGFYAPHLIKLSYIERDPNFITIFPSITSTPDAVDVAISMESMELDRLLDRNIIFIINTSDWFAVETVKRLRAISDRECFLIDPKLYHLVDVVREILKTGTFRKIVRRNEEKEARITCLIRELIEKVDNNRHLPLSLSIFGALVPLSEKDKYELGSWKTILSTPVARKIDDLYGRKLGLDNILRSGGRYTEERSPPVSPRRSPPVSPRRSPPVSPRRSPPVSPRRSPPVSPRRSPPVSPRRSPPVSPRRSPPVSPRRSPPVPKKSIFNPSASVFSAPRKSPFNPSARIFPTPKKSPFY